MVLKCYQEMVLVGKNLESRALEEIAETLSLPLAFVQELARPKAVMA